MEHITWLKQTKPLFPELDWNKPERRDQAGRLLIVGGNAHNFSAPAKAYELTKQVGIGTIKMVLPDKTRRMLQAILPEALYLASTSSGEFASETINELLEYALWSDSVLLPGNLGRNSQTSILIEELLRSFNGQMVLTNDAIEAVSNNPDLLLGRDKTTLVISFAQLQKLMRTSNRTRHISYGMDLVQLVETLHYLSKDTNAAILTVHQNQCIVAHAGKISTTKRSSAESQVWRLAGASYAACFLTWNPSKPFESLTHAASLLY